MIDWKKVWKDLEKWNDEETKKNSVQGVHLGPGWRDMQEKIQELVDEQIEEYMEDMVYEIRDMQDRLMD